MHTDLLWGLRGGGGNFGVVSSFEYQLHALGPEVLGGGVIHSFADAPEVFRFFAEFVSEAPDELSVTASTFRAAPGAAGAVRDVWRAGDDLGGLLCRELSAGEKALRSLRNFGRPLADLIAPMPYTTLQSASDAAYPTGEQIYWRSHYIDEITDDVIATLVEHAPRMPSPLSSFYFQHLGGAISRTGAEHAAFGHRDGEFDFAILTVWQDPAQTDENVAWARDFFDAMEPHSTGVYVNNLGTEGADRVKAAYAPATYDRLVGLKRTYDPNATRRASTRTSRRLQRSSAICANPRLPLGRSEQAAECPPTHQCRPARPELRGPARRQPGVWLRVGPANAEPTRSRSDLTPHLETGAGGDRRRRPAVHGADDLAAVYSLQVDARDAEVRVLDMRVIWRPLSEPVDRVEQGLARRAWDTRWARSGGRPEGGRSGAPTACAPSGRG